MEEQKVRAFLAVPFSSFYEQELSVLVNELKSRRIHAKWVRVHDVHLTLHFFGYLSEDRVDAIGKALHDAVERLHPFQLTLQGMGGFPTLRRPRVLWIGFGGQVDELKRLKTATDAALNSVKIPIEERPFKAHLTLARLKSNLPGDGNKLLSDLVDYSCDRSFKVEEVVFFKSVLTSQGPVYSRLHTFQLHGFS